ncbi:malto-oligosyltrehalose trehalohydrolase [Pseudolysinimonas sp.]|uniref:malto-oligosyltrehalose trehalohydrolase n=1 Tax=Pseudolysinimonas sp. TaxID=2680009 RepID=UPI003F7DDDAD
MIPEVWAPRPERVRLWTENGAREMRRGDGDVWHADVELAPGDRYGFLLDDDETPLPDPRGRRLADGIHGPSTVVDPAVFADAGDWAGRELAGAVIYELHLGTFTPEGTADSAIARLDELVDLGVDFVEPLPVNGFEGSHNWGYDGVAWFAVDESYGGPAAYRRFVDACHRRGLGVIQDVVYNHLGPAGNYLPRFGPYLRTEGGNTWGDTVALEEPAVFAYVLENALMWLQDYGVDGLRLDAVHALADDRRDDLLTALSRQAERIERNGVRRPIALIAESDMNDARLITPVEDGGDGLTAQWSDDYHHAVHVALTGETEGYYADFASLDALVKTATRGFFHDGTYSSFRGRPHGAPIPETLEPWRLVTFSQDHDQIGNRATGDRLTATLSPDRLAIAAVLTICSPFTPMLFMGEEWGASTPWQFFTAHRDPDLGRATAEGRIAEFARMGWDAGSVPDPQDPGTFERSRLDWAERDEEPHARLLRLYRELIALRRREPAFGSAAFGDLKGWADDATGRVRLRIRDLEVRVNLGAEPWETDGGELLVATRDGVESGLLPPDSAAVIRMHT